MRRFWSNGRGALLGVVAVGLGIFSVALPDAALSAQVPTAPRWTIQASPSEAGATASSLSAVSCRSGGTCMAVGTYYSGPDSDQFTLTELRQGSTWAIEPTPPIAGVDYSELSGVSCAGPTSCTAVGYTVTSRSDSIVRALAEQWNGSSWTIEPTPLPKGAKGDDLWVTLAGVSCPHPEFCIAVGGYIKNENTGEEQPLAEQWNGASWSVLAAPNPHAENGSSFTGVDCLAPDDCEVVGEYDYADVGQSVFADGYNGSHWASQKQVNPLGQELNSDTGVSCTGGDACTSVGSWTNNYTDSLVEYWDGSSWSTQHARRPARAVTDELDGVSCLGGMSCTAVGDSSDSQDEYPTHTLADEWDGTSWQIATTPNPDGDSSLAAVSCTAPTACVAVGSSYGATAGTTLVETYSA